MLRKRRARMAEEKLDLSRPIAFETREEQLAAIAFFNAAFRAEESGLRQAHALSEETARWDADLAECLKLYGDEEGWRRQLLTEFLAWIGGEVRPMGRATRAFYGLYRRAERMEPSRVLLRAFGLEREALSRAPSAIGLEAAERAAMRENVSVEAY